MGTIAEQFAQYWAIKDKVRKERRDEKRSSLLNTGLSVIRLERRRGRLTKEIKKTKMIKSRKDERS